MSSKVNEQLALNTMTADYGFSDVQRANRSLPLICSAQPSKLTEGCSTYDRRSAVSVWKVRCFCYHSDLEAQGVNLGTGKS